MPIRYIPRFLLLAVLAAGTGCGHFESVETPPLLSTAGQAEWSPVGQWTGYRGALLQGVAADRGLPTQFGEGLHTRWAVAVPGVGNSSPIVSGDRVFLTAESSSQPPELLVLCFDRNSGAIVWQQSVGAPIGGTHRKNGYATATMATDGQRVYATFGANGVFCFSLDGQRLWNSPLDQLEHEWGHASSPVLWGELVLQLADGAQGSRLVALHCHSGEVVWSTERMSTGSWTTPVLVNSSVGGPARWEVVVNGTGSSNGAPGFVIAYDPATGVPLWHVQGTTDIPCPAAIVGNSLIVSTSGPNGPIFAVRPGGQDDVTQSHVAWRIPWGGAYVPTGVIVGQWLYLITDGGTLRCLALADGHEIWEKQLHCSYSAGLVAGDDKLFVVSEQGDIHVLSTGDRCQVLAVSHLHQRCLATPAIADGALFVRTQENLYCFANAHPLAGQSTPASAETLTPVSTTVEPLVTPLPK